MSRSQVQPGPGGVRTAAAEPKQSRNQLQTQTQQMHKIIGSLGIHFDQKARPILVRYYREIVGKIDADEIRCYERRGRQTQED